MVPTTPKGVIRVKKGLKNLWFPHILGTGWEATFSGGMCVGSISGISIRSLKVYSKRYAILVCDSSVVDSCPGSVRSGLVLTNVAITDDQLKFVLFTTPLFGQNHGNICEISKKRPAANRTSPLVGSPCVLYFFYPSCHSADRFSPVPKKSGSMKKSDLMICV